jgi:hypothetical protein
MIGVVAAAILLDAELSQPTEDPPFEVSITQPEASPSVLRVRFRNTGKHPLCFALNNGARLFDIQRRGVSLAMNEPLPSAPPPSCFLVQPDETRMADFDLGMAFPALKRDDRACFNAWYRRPDEQAHDTDTWVCNLLDRE